MSSGEKKWIGPSENTTPDVRCTGIRAQGGIATVPFLARQYASTPIVARHVMLGYSRDVGEQTHKHILQERRLFQTVEQVNPTVQNTAETLSHLCMGSACVV